MAGFHRGATARALGLVAAGVILSGPLQASAAMANPWRAQNSGTENHLHGIFAFDGCHAWAVGEETGDNVGQSVIVATRDGGAHWYKQSFPPGSAMGTSMNRVAFTSPRTGYAVGENNNQTGLSNGEAGKPNFLRTTNGGVTWVDLSANLPAEASGVGISDIEGLSVIDEKVWITVGAYPANQSNPGTGLILFSPNRGNTWEVQASYSLASFDSVSMANDTHGWATSNDSKLWRTTNGSDWSIVASTTSSGEQVVGLSSRRAVIVEDGGTIEYTNNGTALKPAKVPSQVHGRDFTDVSIGGEGVGYATGELNGAVLATRDSGRTWRWQDSNVPGMNTYNGVTVAHDKNAAWIAGESGSIAANMSARHACRGEDSSG